MQIQGKRYNLIYVYQCTEYMSLQNPAVLLPTQFNLWHQNCTLTAYNNLCLD